MISNSQLVVAIAAISCGLVFTIPSTIDYAHGDNINHGVFAIDSQPYGKPYAEWAGKWNQWLISVPQPLNPATDHTGNNCGQNQAGPVVVPMEQQGDQPNEHVSYLQGRLFCFPLLVPGAIMPHIQM